MSVDTKPISEVLKTDYFLDASKLHQAPKWMTNMDGGSSFRRSHSLRQSKTQPPVYSDKTFPSTRKSKENGSLGGRSVNRRDSSADRNSAAKNNSLNENRPSKYVRSFRSHSGNIISLYRDQPTSERTRHSSRSNDDSPVKTSVRQYSPISVIPYNESRQSFGRLSSPKTIHLQPSQHPKPTTVFNSETKSIPNRTGSAMNISVAPANMNHNEWASPATRASQRSPAIVSVVQPPVMDVHSHVQSPLNNQPYWPERANETIRDTKRYIDSNTGLAESFQRTQSSGNLHGVNSEFFKANGPEDVMITEEIRPGPDPDSDLVIRRKTTIKKLIREPRSSEVENRHFTNEQTRPYKTLSQSNVNGPNNGMMRMTNTWTSDSNIRGTLGNKSTYSAHRENMRKQEELRSQGAEHWQSARNVNEMGGTEVFEELETITLQPIGRGVHSLDAGSTLPRVSRTPTPNNFVQPNMNMSTYARQGWSAHENVPRRPSISHISSGQRRDFAFEQSNLSPQLRISSRRPWVGSENAINDMSRMQETRYTLDTGSMRWFPTQNKQNYTSVDYNYRTPRNEQPIEVNRDGYRSTNGFYYEPNQQSYNPLGYQLGMGNNAGSLNSIHSNKGMTFGYDRISNGFRASSRPQSPLSTYNRGGMQGYDTNMSRSPVVANPPSFAQYNTYSYQQTQQADQVDQGTLYDLNNPGIRMAQDCSQQWYFPDISRDEAISLLRNKRSGSFVIRKSTTFANSFGLAIKVDKISPKLAGRSDDPASDYVRHFLIESLMMPDGKTMGVHLKGFNSEATYPNLASFVHHHSQRQGALPCLLTLPGQAGSINGDTYATRNHYASTSNVSEVLYLGDFDVDKLENEAAVRRAVTELISKNGRLPKRCRASVRVSPQNGIDITDVSKATYMKKHIRPGQLIWCGFDPDKRDYCDEEMRKKRVPESRMFGLVCKRQKVLLHENSVHVMCELMPGQAMSLVNYINRVFGERQ